MIGWSKTSDGHFANDESGVEVWNDGNSMFIHTLTPDGSVSVEVGREFAGTIINLGPMVNVTIVDHDEVSVAVLKYGSVTIVDRDSDIGHCPIGIIQLAWANPCDG